MRQLLPAFAFALAALSTTAAVAADAASIPTISIQGKGEVMAGPDSASVSLGVTTEGTTAREALDANTKAMTDLIAALKAAKIDDKDIQTSGFSVNPQYVYPDRDANGNTPPPRITGYNVANGVSVTIRQLDALGSILDQVVSAGGNTINGVAFSVADPSKLLDEARKAAFADAEEKAKVYADAAGVGLGPVVSIAESEDNNAPRPFLMKAMAAPADAAVPVQPGQLSFDVNVAVVWSLKTGTD
ncbi:MAG: SIMPL domain-containing protein [Devosia sp.]|nr:SIMPL domain-containing protein [Devosia sp.]